MHLMWYCPAGAIEIILKDKSKIDRYQTTAKRNPSAYFLGCSVHSNNCVFQNDSLARSWYLGPSKKEVLPFSGAEHLWSCCRRKVIVLRAYTSLALVHLGRVWDFSSSQLSGPGSNDGTSESASVDSKQNIAMTGYLDEVCPILELSLKTKYFYDNNFVFIGSIWICRYEILRCHQWRQCIFTI